MWTESLDPNVLQHPQLQIPAQISTSVRSSQSLSSDWGFLDSVEVTTNNWRHDSHSLKKVSNSIVQAKTLPYDNSEEIMRIFSFTKGVIEHFYKQQEREMMIMKEQKRKINKLKSQLEEIKQKEQNRNKVIGLKCPVCLVFFKSMESLDYHIATHHQNYMNAWRALRQPQNLPIEPLIATQPNPLQMQNNASPNVSIQNNKDMPTILLEFKEEMKREHKVNEEKMMNLFSERMSMLENKFDEKMSTLSQTLPSSNTQQINTFGESSCEIHPSHKDNDKRHHHATLNKRHTNDKKLSLKKPKPDLIRKKNKKSNENSLSDEIVEDSNESGFSFEKEEVHQSPPLPKQAKISPKTFNNQNKPVVQKHLSLSSSQTIVSVDASPSNTISKEESKPQTINKPKLQLAFQNTTEIINESNSKPKTTQLEIDNLNTFANDNKLNDKPKLLLQMSNFQTELHLPGENGFNENDVITKPEITNNDSINKNHTKQKLKISGEAIEILSSGSELSNGIPTKKKVKSNNPNDSLMPLDKLKQENSNASSNSRRRIKKRRRIIHNDESSTSHKDSNQKKLPSNPALIAILYYN